MADVTDATFEADVIERSKTVPVVVDLWAPWCGPCKALTPILEKVIGETKGMVELAKVDADENPAVFQAFQVQGIPAVFGFIDGQVVDGFMGGQPESMVVEFVQRLLDMKAGLIPVGQPGEDGDADVSGGDAADGDVADEPAGAEVDAAVGQDAVISEPGGTTQPVVDAAPAISAEEADAIEAELDELLTVVKGDDDAREKFLGLLAQLGPDDPRTNTYRRKLATALF